ncbi:Peptidylprolyl isomerase [Mycena indigotica]|uniref:Peptidylprolyl isomerase n=1 Tax=Mycena indigotica TaxID=2126181 RepID=A0A8H6SQ76_9AGAR|nr:Peptidylprolyl isomerase [Mycena indigotica]KAF7303424.1 Peptidylprolyl isomerase [Mycena indigotica]
MLVAGRVKEWVEHLACHTMIVTSSLSHIDFISQTIRQITRPGFDRLAQRKGTAFLAAAVKSILLSYELSKDDIREILTICSGIEEFIIYSGVRVYGALDLLPKLRRLRCSIGQFFDIYDPDVVAGLSAQPSLANVTHLELFLVGLHDEPFPVWIQALSLPALTHFATSSHALILEKYPDLNEAVLDALTDPERPFAIFVVVDYMMLLQDESPLKLKLDKKLSAHPGFVHFSHGRGAWATDWSNHTLGGDDFWSYADEFARKRRSGELPKDKFELLDPSAIPEAEAEAEAEAEVEAEAEATEEDDEDEILVEESDTDL